MEGCKIVVEVIKYALGAVMQIAAFAAASLILGMCALLVAVAGKIVWSLIHEAISKKRKG